jgi:ribosomal protein S26
MKTSDAEKGKKRARKRKKEEKPAVKPIRIKAEVRTCDELKAIIATRINAHVKDARVAKQLENALMDMVAYGTGGTGKGISS